jgi:arginine/lysine/ornithine decarboxylase
MASLDLARRQMALRGEALMERTVELAGEARERLSRTEGLMVLGEEHLPKDAAGLDATRLVVSVRGLGLTGYQVGRLLAERYRVFVEMADAFNIVAVVSIGATRDDCGALVSALEDIAVRDRQVAGASMPEAPSDYIKRMRPRDAWFSPACKVPLAEAAGRICAEPVAVYPPGIPALNPGEEITPDIVEYLMVIREMGLPCQGPSDHILKTIKVVIE